MTDRTIGIVIEGATGRLGTTQHLRSLMAIRAEGGLPLDSGDRLVPEPMLLGRNPAKLAALAAANGGLKWSTDRDACLADPDIAIYFDASATGGRPERAGAAIDAGKHVYLEKPIAETLPEALALARRAHRAGLKNGVVQDKLFLPGLRKLRKLYDADFFGRVLSVRLDFGWWVFDGELYPAQRPSWNYRKATGGGLVLDMFAHWRYIFDRLLGEIKAVSCRHTTAIPRRRDESGKGYEVDVEDLAFATFELAGGVLAQVSSSWASRVKRDDLLQIQVDGTLGSAVCGLHRCFVAAAGGHAEAVLRPGTAAIDGLRRAMAGAAGRGAVPQRLPGRLGIVSQARRGRRALSVAAARRGKRRPARRGLPSKQPGAPLDRFARADFVIAEGLAR